MQRREFTLAGIGTFGALLLAATQARALSLSGLSNADASSGVKAALEQGVTIAVGLLGQSGGFLNNPSVRIPLPGYLEDAAKLMKRFGQGKRIEELETSLNRAAEMAVPMGKDLLIGAVQTMSVTGKTLDGLFTVIGEEERKLRQNPAAAGSALLQKVFGSLK